MAAPYRHGTIKEWGFLCPICKYSSKGGYSTRKKAKDAYFDHMKKTHAGPGGCLGSP